MLKPGFWDTPDDAQKLMKKKKNLESELEHYEGLLKGFSDISEMIDLAEEYEDYSGQEYNQGIQSISQGDGRSRAKQTSDR